MASSARSTDVRGDPVVWLGLASCAGALALVAPWPVLVAALVTTFLLARTGPRWVAFGVVLALGTGAARAHLVVARHEEKRAAVIAAGAWPSRCTLRGTVARSPVMLG